MTQKEITASVIIPVRNSEKYLGACLESVLNQNFENFEVIAVDNNSTDKTKEIILEFGKKHENLKYVFEHQIGIGAARNTGEQVAQGKVILMTDSDCVAPINWIRDMTKNILNGEALAVQGGEEELGKSTWGHQIDLQIKQKVESYQSGEETVKVDTKNFAIMRSLLKQIGWTDRRYVSGNDTNLYLKLCRKNIKPVFLPDVRIKHHYPKSIYVILRKQFLKAMWCRKISLDDWVTVTNAGFLTETEQVSKSYGKSIHNLIFRWKKNGLGTVSFEIFLSIFWRFGLFWGNFGQKFKITDFSNVNSTDTITAIIPMRNRYDYRIKNCLKGLRNQIYDQALLKIILVDYGSDEKYRADFEKLCLEFNVEGIWTGRSNEMWNRSKCINIALKQTESDYILITDVDVVFGQNYLPFCVLQTREVADLVALYPKLFDAPRGLIDENTDVIGNFNYLFKKTIYRGKDSKAVLPFGAGFIFANTTAVKNIGGFDEFYEGWGSEDFDLVKRLELNGGRVWEVSGFPVVIHQWHPRYEGMVKGKKFEELVRRNLEYCERNVSIIRNIPTAPTIKPKHLPGTIWGITCFFNPANYKNKYENYQIFRSESKRQGLKLVAVELTFDSHPFELKPEDAEILIQLHGGETNILWQKEALLEIALKHLPKDCDKVVWIDGDIIFENNNWVQDTSRLLESYQIVQPFEFAVRMEKGILNLKDFFAFEKNSGKTVERLPSFALASTYKRNLMISNTTRAYVPGFACAARRSVWEQIGLFTRSILGSADSIMLRGFAGWRFFTRLSGVSNGFLKAQDDWVTKAFRLVQNSIFYSPGTIFHLWHGTFADRRYIVRDDLLYTTKFDPMRDVKLDSKGILEWSTDDETIKFGLANYFKIRNEEGRIKNPQAKFKLRDFFKLKILKTKIASWRHLSKIKYKIFIRVFRHRAKRILFFDLTEEYYRYLGLIGQQIRSKNQNLYFKLKKFFPDQN